jgi:ectoine hydroxylase-related dioxygenase (phytanoyl-CoA dioxygenase family)
MVELKNESSQSISNEFNLDTEYPLTNEQVTTYQRDGHIYLPQLARPKEITFYRKEILDAVEKMNTEKRALKDRDTYGKAFLQIFNLWRRNEILKKFVVAKRFGNVAAKLMGVDRVRIYHDQALFKEAGGGHTPWHQDQYYWPLDTNNTITLWMPLIDLTKDMGIMQFASGSHKKGYILSKEISDESEAFFHNYVKDHGYKITGSENIKAGDATFHAGWTLHNAPPNKTNTVREVMTIIYYADKTRIAKPDNSWREKDLEVWLGGKMPGEEANGELNPLV